MPINIACEYECDQCHKKVDGLSGKVPDGWILGFDNETLMKVSISGTVGIFHSRDCYDKYVAALVKAQPQPPPAQTIVAVSAGLSMG